MPLPHEPREWRRAMFRVLYDSYAYFVCDAGVLRTGSRAERDVEDTVRTIVHTYGVLGREAEMLRVRPTDLAQRVHAMMVRIHGVAAHGDWPWLAPEGFRPRLCVVVGGARSLDGAAALRLVAVLKTYAERAPPCSLCVVPVLQPGEGDVIGAAFRAAHLRAAGPIKLARTARLAPMRRLLAAQRERRALPQRIREEMTRAHLRRRRVRRPPPAWAAALADHPAAARLDADVLPAGPSPDTEAAVAPALALALDADVA